MTLFETKRDNYREAVKVIFDRIPIHRFFDIRLENIELGKVTALLKKRPELLQQNGYFQAGALVTLADAVGGAAAYTLTAEGENILSVNFAVALMRPAAAEKLRGEGWVVKAGKNLYFCETAVYDAADPERKPLMTAAVTLMVV
ncbi:MAG: PaaI family thioesterase [Candidatus Zixiibacteriota bacterium]